MIKFLRIGKITKTQGIKGELKIFATTDDFKRYDKLKSFYLSRSEEADDNDIDVSTVYELEGVKYIKDSPIIKVKGIDNIESAVKFIGNSIYVKRDDALNLASNEYYIIDLIGLDVYEDSKNLGKIVDVMKNKVQSILVVKIDGKEKLIPFVNEFIKKVDIESCRVDIKTIEGLV